MCMYVNIFIDKLNNNLAYQEITLGIMDDMAWKIDLKEKDPITWVAIAKEKAMAQWVYL